MNNGEAPNKKPRCQHISKIGARCQADPQTGKDYCFFHDPDQKKKQSEARRQGGEARSRQMEPEITLLPNLPTICLQKTSDVYELLTRTVNHLRRDEIDLHAAKAIGYLSSLLLRALKSNTQPDMIEILADTINRFCHGQMDIRTAKAVGHLTSLMIGALKQIAVEEQAASENEAARPAATIRAQAQRQKLAAGITQMITAKPAKDHELHPAAFNMASANTARPETSHA
ncbi:MAG TPA: hypothetical protein VFA71_07540 [Terriglobales bacterium]|nr:hypothetical protein [Terriglobales bacterium]